MNNDLSGGADTLGLAEFTSGNFIGQRATYAEFFPDHSDIHYFAFPSLADTTQPNLQAGHLWETATHGDVTLENFKHGTRLYISKTNAGVSVTYHSALGYLIAQHPGKASGMPTLTIADDNVLSNYHAIFIPKAVEYSAGLLDYFFRGTLGIAWSGSTNAGQKRIRISNLSGQELNGGQFHIFWDDGNGVRSEIKSSSFTTTYTGSLAKDASIDAEFVPPNGAVDYIVVYQGIIGTGGGTALDPVDAAIALATGRIDCDIVWMLDPVTLGPRGYQPGQTCPWPDDFLSQPGTSYVCDDGEADPWRWAATEGSPVDSRSSVKQNGSSLQITLDSHVFSNEEVLNSSSDEYLYLRKRIDGGATGKHVVMHGEWTFPGGSWVASYFNLDDNAWYDYDEVAALRIMIGHKPEEFFWAFWPHNYTDVYVFETPASGIIDYAFDVPPGVIDYACGQIDSWTRENGPSTFKLTVTVTDN